MRFSIYEETGTNSQLTVITQDHFPTAAQISGPVIRALFQILRLGLLFKLKTYYLKLYQLNLFHNLFCLWLVEYARLTSRIFVFFSM